MSIWQQFFGAIRGGWKTYGPNSIAGAGAFDSAIDSTYDTVTSDTAMRLSAVWACMNLRAETIGTLPLHLRDENKQVLRDHPLYTVLHDSPNSMQTAAEFWSLATAHLDMYGNAISVVERRTNGSVISLEPVDPTLVQLEQTKTGAWKYKIGGSESYKAENILHLRGFSMSRNWGLPRLDIGKYIIGAQLSANESAHRAFRQSLKLGGFFAPEHNMTDPQIESFNKRLDRYALPENNGKFLTLLKGMKPISGADFRIKPSDAELLASRYFGIEEICRLFNVPPQLIGHTDKASSWASSIEQVNLFYTMYSIMPTVIRNEQRISKTLLTADDRARGVRPKFNMAGLARADLQTRQAFYASALQNGYLNRNEVRDMEDRTAIEHGETYTVQLNMAELGKKPPATPPA